MGPIALVLCPAIVCVLNTWLIIMHSTRVFLKFNPSISPNSSWTLKKNQCKNLLGQTCYSQTKEDKCLSVTVGRFYIPIL